jgi:hypothetical protein
VINATGLSSANKDPVEVLGKAGFEVQLGNFIFRPEVIVAEIEDECLLGLDEPSRWACDYRFK